MNQTVMTQSVNLYYALPNKRCVRLPVSIIWRILLWCLIGLMCLYGYTFWRINVLNKQVDKVLVSKKMVSRNVQVLNKRYHELLKQSSLAQNNTALSQAVAVKRQMAQMLGNRETFATAGFSNYLTAFAQKITPQVWLNHIQIQRSGENIVLTGKAHQVKAILKFMDHLRYATPFTDTHLKLASLEQSKENNKAVFSFVLTAAGDHEAST